MDFTILLIDDEEAILASLGRDLRKAGYTVHTAGSGAEGIQRLQEHPVNLVITDLCMEGIDGITVLKEAKKINPAVMAIVLTGFGTMSTAVDAMRAGAYDYITKPCDRTELLLRVGHCLEKLELEKDVRQRTGELEKSNAKLEAAAQKHRALAISLRETNERLEQSNTELKRLSSLDGLTGIPNRRMFDEHLDVEWKRAIREKSLLSLIMVDIDFFKNFNDTYGHLAGDDCLRRVARTIQETLRRPADLAVRYGGEEFAALLPGTDKAGALALAQELLAGVQALSIPNAGSLAVKTVTISLGVATLTPSPETKPEALIEAADKALYKAKSQGRNRILVAH